jgi:outer membrane protein
LHSFHRFFKRICARFQSVGAMCVCVLALVYSSSYAQNTSTNAGDLNFSIQRVAIIDIGDVLRQSDAVGKVRTLLDSKRKEIQQEFAAKERELFEREKNLKSQKSVLSEEAYRSQVAVFQADVAEVQKQIQATRQSLDNAFRDMQDQIRQIAVDLVTEYSQANDIDLVLNRQSALIFRNQLDISSVILEKLNERTQNARFELDQKQSN